MTTHLLIATQHQAAHWNTALPSALVLDHVDQITWRGRRDQWTWHQSVPAEALRGLKDWSGATGPFSFGANGELKYKPIVSKIMRQGRFEPLEKGMLR